MFGTIGSSRWGHSAMWVATCPPTSLRWAGAYDMDNTPLVQALIQPFCTSQVDHKLSLQGHVNVNARIRLIFWYWRWSISCDYDNDLSKCLPLYKKGVGQVDVGSHTGSCLHAGVIIRDYGRSVAKGQSGPWGYFQTHLFTIHNLWIIRGGRLPLKLSPERFMPHSAWSYKSS